MRAFKWLFYTVVVEPFILMVLINTIALNISLLPIVAFKDMLLFCLCLELFLQFLKSTAPSMTEDGIR